jgi:aryl-alcohol dehydrogenase-like predicted oxidoreductase
MRLALGTAQFGLDYGVSNSDGKCPPPEAARIIERAAQAGVSLIDTAPVYGDAEQILGDILPTGHGFSIVTKTPSVANCRTPDEAADLVERTLETSLERMHVSRAHAVLVHHADELFGAFGEAVFARLASLQDGGATAMIGVSVYTGDQIDRVTTGFAMQTIQAPINVLDQRLVSNGNLKRLKDAGFEIQGRSIFLQGLLLMGMSALPAQFGALRSDLKRYHDAREAADLSKVEAAVGFVAHLPQINHVIVGVTSVGEFEEIAAAAQADLGGALDWPSFAATNHDLLDPSQWSMAS